MAPLFGFYSWQWLSLRSKKLVNSIQKYLLPDDLNSAEDVVICRYLRARLEENDGLRFAPEKIAEMFSYEMRKPNFDTFGFHGLSNLPEVMVGEIEELFEYLQPQSVAKFFRSFSSACEKLPIDGKELFDQYCLRHQTEMLYHAKLNAKTVKIRTSIMNLLARQLVQAAVSAK